MEIRKTLTMLFAAMLAAVCMPQALALPLGATPKLPVDAAESMPWGADAKTYGADLPVHVGNGHIYMEVSEACIGREMLVGAQIDRGFDYIAQPIASLGVVRIAAPNGQTIRLQRLGTSGNAAPASSSSADNADLNYPIVTRTKAGAAVIDITNDLLTDSRWFSVDRMIDIREMADSLSSLCEVQAGEGVTRFLVRRYYGCQAQDNVYSSSLILLPDASAPLDVTCFFELLSPASSPLRLADQGVASLIKTAKTAGVSGQDSVFVQRWRLEEPLVFYVDSLFPPQYFNAVKAAVATWNEALAKVGRPNALQLQWVTPQTSMAKRRVNLSFALNTDKMTPQMLAHPHSGELLRGWINIGFKDISGKGADYFVRQPHLDPRFWDAAYIDELEQETLQGALMVHVARVLGINSEADYGPGALQVTETDARALAYAYAPAEGKTLGEQRTNLLLALADKQESKKDAPTFEKQTRIMDNVLLLLPQIDNKTHMAELKKDKGYSLYSIYRFALNTYVAQLEHLAMSIISKKSEPVRRREVMRLLAKYFVLADSGLNSRLVNQNQLAWKTDVVGADVDRIFDELLDVSALRMLMKQGQQKGGYTADEHVNQLANTLFCGFDARQTPSNILANLQLRFMTSLLSATKSAQKGSGVQLWMQQKTRTLQAKLRTMAQQCQDVQSQSWYLLLSNRR